MSCDHSPRTTPRLAPYSGRTAQCPRVRALCAAFPARSPLLRALTRSLRAASVFLPRPHSLNKTRERGQEHYGSTTRVNRQKGRPIRKRTGGKPGTPPAPLNGPGSRFSPRPPFLPPRKATTDPAAQMTGESARHRPRIPRRACRTRKPARRQGNPGNPPKPGFPGSPGPPPALPPARGRAPRATTDSNTAPTPAYTENSTPAPAPSIPPHPGPASSCGLSRREGRCR